MADDGQQHERMVEVRIPGAFVPAPGAEDWKKLHPARHWKTERSAQCLAECWVPASDFPAAVKRVLKASTYEDVRGAEILLALPELQVDLDEFRGPSHNDLFVLARTPRGLVSIAVEAKVDEPFGPLVREYLADRNPRSKKPDRLRGLLHRLGLPQRPEDILEQRYQLFHRTASALILAEKFTARSAMMMVHSFGGSNTGLIEYGAFVELFGMPAPRKDEVAFAGERKGLELYFAWIDNGPFKGQGEAE